MNSDNLKTLDKLLKELDYFPLAIRLFATVSKGLSLSYLLKQWREERNELLASRKDQQSSIAIVVSISILLLLECKYNTYELIAHRSSFVY